MNTGNGVEAKNRYQELKKKLQENKYYENFSVEAVGLVDRLLSDLISTTNAYKQLQDKENRLNIDLGLAQAQLFPIRKENARLARENHELHIDQIKQTDNIRSIEEEYNSRIRNAELQLEESKLLIKAKDSEITLKNQNLDRIREAFEAQSDPKAVVHSRGIKLSDRLSAAHGESRSGDQENRTMGRDTENSVIETLRSQVSALSSSLRGAEDEVKRLNTAIAAREQELSRSSKLMSIVSSTHSETEFGSLMPANRSEQLLAADTANRRIIDQLNGQVDFLNDQLALREKQIEQGSEKLSSFEQLRAELEAKAGLLQQVRFENNTLLTKFQVLQQKNIDLQYELEQAVAVSAAKSVAQTQQGSPESKGHSDDQQVTDATKDTLIATLSSENEQLQEEVKRLRASLEVVVAPPKRGPGAKASGTAAGAMKAATHGGVAESNRLIVDLNREVEKLRKQLAAVQRSLVQSEDRSKVLEADKQALAQRLKLHDTTRDRSTVLAHNRELQEQLTRSQLVGEELVAERDQLRDLVHQTNNDREQLRRDLGEALSASQQSETSLEIVSAELHAVKESVSSLSAELRVVREKASSNDIVIVDLRGSVDLLERRLHKAQSDLSAAQHELVRRNADVATAAEKIAQLRYETAPAEVVEQQRMENRRLEAQLERLKLENQELHVQFEHISRFLNAGKSAQQLQLEAEQHERGSVVERLREKEAVIVELRTKCESQQKLLDRRSSEEGGHEVVVDVMREEIFALKASRQAQQLEVGGLQADLNLAKQREAYALGERDQLQSELDVLRATSAQLSDQLAVAHRDLQHLHDQLNQQREDYSALEESCATARQHTEHLQRRTRAGQEDVHSVLAGKAEAERKLQEHRVLLGNSEASARIHMQKIDSLQDRLKVSEKNVTALDTELSKLKVVLADRDQRVADLQVALQRLDEERDALQSELDDSEGKVEDGVEANRELQRLVEQLRHMAAEQERAMDSLKKELRTSHQQKLSAEARTNALQVEYNSLRHKYSECETEVKSAASDLMLMTRENQAITSELASTAADRDALRTRLGELSHTLAISEQSYRALEMEKNDLLETYRSVAQDKRRLEGSLAAMSESKQRDGASAQQQQMHLSELQSAIQAYKNNQRVWSSEKIALGKQLEVLNDQLVQCHERLAQEEAENRRIKQDTQGLRQTNAMLNERINLIISRATSATEANKVLQTRLAAVERERDAVRSLVGIERQRAVEMGQVAQAARTQAATKDMQLQSILSQTQSEEVREAEQQQTTHSTYTTTNSNVKVEHTTTTSTLSESHQHTA